MKNPFSYKLLKILLVLAISLITLHLGLKYISVQVYSEQHGFFFELANRFDFNDENSVPQWLSQTLFLGIGVTAAVASYLAVKKAERRLWAIVAGLGVILSLDDASTMHEFVLQSLHNTFFVDTAPTFLRNAWLLILPFVGLGFAWLCYRMYKLLPRRTTIKLAVSGVVFVIGAVIVDSFANNVVERSFAGQGLMGALEGGLQMLALIVFTCSLVEYVETTHRKRLAAAVAALNKRL